MLKRLDRITPKKAIITNQTQQQVEMTKRGWIQEAVEKAEVDERETEGDCGISDYITNGW